MDFGRKRFLKEILSGKLSVNLEKEERNCRCPRCKSIFVLEKSLNKKTTKIKCPICGHIGFLTKQKPRIEQLGKMNYFFGESAHIAKSPLRERIIGLIIFLIGLNSFILSGLENIKFSITLIFISFVLFFLVTEKNQKDFDRKNDQNRFRISDNIPFLLIVITIFLYFLSYTYTVDIFLILLYLVMLVLTELCNEFITREMKKRMNLLLIFFFIIFISIIFIKFFSISN